MIDLSKTYLLPNNKRRFTKEKNAQKKTEKMGEILKKIEIEKIDQ